MAGELVQGGRVGQERPEPVVNLWGEPTIDLWGQRNDDIRIHRCPDGREVQRESREYFCTTRREMTGRDPRCD